MARDQRRRPLRGDGVEQPAPVAGAIAHQPAEAGADAKPGADPEQPEQETHRRARRARDVEERVAHRPGAARRRFDRQPQLARARPGRHQQRHVAGSAARSRAGSCTSWPQRRATRAAAVGERDDDARVAPRRIRAARGCENGWARSRRPAFRIAASARCAARPRPRIGLCIASRPSAKRIASARSGTPLTTRSARQTPSRAGTGQPGPGLRRSRAMSCRRPRRSLAGGYGQVAGRPMYT